MTRSALVALYLIVPIAASAADGGVSVEVLRSDFACRDHSDMVRLGLRWLDGEKAGFLDFYKAHQAVGKC